ncbi:MAG: ComF family protein [bacterium]
MEPDRRRIKPVTWLLALRNFSLSVLFPAGCAICRKPLDWSHVDPVCPACWMKVRPIEGPICYRCGYPISAEAGSTPVEEIYCESCQKRSPAYIKARSVFYYQDILRELVHRFKYQGQVNIGKMLARYMIRYWSIEPDFLTSGCIIPVPLGIKKLRKREFNQSFILAREIGRHLRIRVYPLAMRKVRDGVPQMQLSREERIQSVRGSFAVASGQSVEERDVLLVDDVCTTGATIAECSRVLLHHGAKKVRVITLARSMLQ